MQVCTSLQTDNHASTPLLSFFTGRMPFLPPNQQRQSTEGRLKFGSERKKHPEQGITEQYGKLKRESKLGFMALTLHPFVSNSVPH